MNTYLDSIDQEAAEAIVRTHASDVARVRELLEQSIAAAYGQWLPRHAIVDALLLVLAQQSHGTDVSLAAGRPGQLS